MFIGKNKKHFPAIDKDLCILCGVCEAVCPKMAILVDKDKVDFKQDECNRCMSCVSSCPVEALK